MEDIKLINDLRELNKNDFYITCNGKIVQRHEEIKEGNLYRIVPRLLGGKGGKILNHFSYSVNMYYIYLHAKIIREVHENLVYANISRCKPVFKYF